MKWEIIYAKEREEELTADTFQEAWRIAKTHRKEGEIVRMVRLKR